MIMIGFAFTEDCDGSMSAPSRATSGSAGWDVRANFGLPLRGTGVEIKPGAVVSIPTGLILEIPKGFECQVRSRSGLAKDFTVFVLHSPGTIDSDFRGEVCVLLANFGDKDFKVNHGDRIAQLIFSALPEVGLERLENLQSTDRDSGGFGSTGYS